MCLDYLNHFNIYHLQCLYAKVSRETENHNFNKDVAVYRELSIDGMLSGRKNWVRKSCLFNRDNTF